MAAQTVTASSYHLCNKTGQMQQHARILGSSRMAMGQKVFSCASGNAAACPEFPLPTKNPARAGGQGSETEVKLFCYRIIFSPIDFPCVNSSR
jgi:hypothetical protein